MSSQQVALKKTSGKYSAEEKKFHIEQWKLSKLTRSEYCRRAGLCLQTFSYWFNDKKAAAPTAKPAALKHQS